MVRFNELTVTPDGQRLIIDVSIVRDDTLPDLTISQIIVDTQDTYIEGGPSNNPVYSYTPVTTELNPLTRTARLVLTTADIPLAFNKTIFFVYVLLDGYPDDYNDCCDVNNGVYMATTVNLYVFYRETVKYMKEIEKTCEMPKSLLDLLLQMKAFELSIKTGHYPQAITFWNKFLKRKNIPSVVTKHTCACNYGTGN